MNYWNIFLGFDGSKHLITDLSAQICDVTIDGGAVEGPCAIIFDGTQQTGTSVALPIGEHECCDMPLNDAAESISVTSATGLWIIIYDHFQNKHD